MFGKKIIITSIFFTLLVVLAFVFRPVPNASPENTIKTVGTIDEVFKAGDDDVIIKLKGDYRLYYISQGLKDGVTLTSLQVELPGKSVEIHYVKYWTPIDPLSRLKHISKVDVEQTTLFTSLEQ
jgi:hypothetical protein